MANETTLAQSLLDDTWSPMVTEEMSIIQERSGSMW